MSGYPLTSIASAAQVHRQLCAHVSADRFPTLLKAAHKARQEGQSFFDLAPGLIKLLYDQEKPFIDKWSQEPLRSMEAMVDVVARFSAGFPENSASIKPYLTKMWEAHLALIEGNSQNG